MILLMNPRYECTYKQVCDWHGTLGGLIWCTLCWDGCSACCSTALLLLIKLIEHTVSNLIGEERADDNIASHSIVHAVFLTVANT